MTHTSGTGMTPFDEFYDLPDPRGYFRALGPWGYRTPHHAQEIFRRLVAARGGAATPVVDICCSYGINAALLNHEVTLDDLYARYTSPEIAALTTAELIEADRLHFAARRRPGAAPVTGLDVAAHAVSYACAVGLLDDGFAENLETAPPSAALRERTRDARLITLTGGASFLTGRTLDALLDAAREPVWVAAFVLRTASYGPIEDALAAHGLHTEKVTSRTFPQRRFTGDRERRYAVDAVTAAHEDPAGKESEGWFHAALYVSRSPADVKEFPLAALLPCA
ncbi:hypothetical protein [Streptomyces sp. ISL-11]|uniref:hypothetical protein n=1 Tax=Streptomyces sp. ISL-11 TaxID=2819174 RepID=UPI001BE53F1D|nr:hypothetical protein [Streptomyces sp. ISL-11]MBT2386063.1 hypothetical protein [Streptomyces sp. ISL-11]